MNSKKYQILKISASTDLSNLKTSMYNYLLMNKGVILDAIGEKSTYIATRAIIFAQRMFPENVSLIVDPGVVVVDTPQGERKAIRLTVELKVS